MLRLLVSLGRLSEGNMHARNHRSDPDNLAVA